MGRQMRTSSRRTRRVIIASVAAATLTAAAAGCGGGSDDKAGGGSSPSGSSGASVTLPSLTGQNLEVAAVWTGPEQKNFVKVLDEFEKRTGATVKFVPTGDNTSTFLGTKIQGGQPPDVAFLPQVGVLRQFAEKGWLKPVDSGVQAQLDKNFTKGWQELGAYQGKQYGVYAKAANKSLVWYNTASFETAGITEDPATWADFLTTAQTVYESGTPAVSVGGANGWTLTDWFENVYLSQAGPEKYDQLAEHKIKWTDPSVKAALTTLAELFGNKDLVAGGTSGALQTDFPKSVTQTFTDPPKAAMVYEGDFVGAFITANSKAKVGTDAKVFPFPAVGTGKAPVVSGGDVAVALKDSKGAQALLTFLASTDAAKIWASSGGFVSPNKSLDLSAYPDDVSRSIAKALVAAGDDFRFDMSDQAPAAFGGTDGKGEWKDLQDFLADPKDIAGTQSQLEADAAKAYANS
jgi:multiple sugar transport system substrate-binding protein/alpha-glucoside transport system substrate-binding protein